MALPAKKERDLHRTDVLEVVPPSLKLPPVPSDCEPGKITTGRKPASENVAVATEKIATLSGQVSARVELTLHDLSNRTLRFSREMQQKAGRIKDDNPLKALGLVAGVTFVAGIMLRIWRSQKNG